ncbi:hypothetical protein Tco_1448824 [Tanacetum coccineum]
MLAPAQGKGSAILAGSQPTPTVSIPSTSQSPIPPHTEPSISSPSRITNRQEPEIPQSQGPTPTPVADEATTTSVEVDAEGAATTTASLEAGLDSGNIHESPLRSYDAPLPEVSTSRSAEDSVQLKELMELVPKLVLRIGSLEKELTKTTQIFGNEVLTLKNMVKTLEVSLKSKSKKVVLSESEGEEAENSSKQGRKSQDDRSKDFITSLNSGEAQEQDISPTLLDATNTLTQIASGGVSTYKRRRRFVDTGMDYFSAAKEKNQARGKEKQKMVEENVQTVQKAQKHLEQEKAGFAEELVKNMQGEGMSEEDFAKRMVDMINQRKKYFAEERAKAKRRGISKIDKEEDTWKQLVLSLWLLNLLVWLIGRYFSKKYRANRPEDVYDRVLWSDLRTMFEPSLSEDAICSLPLQQKMLNWRYYDSCGVHSSRRKQNKRMFMLLEVRLESREVEDTTLKMMVFKRILSSSED